MITDISAMLGVPEEIRVVAIPIIPCETRRESETTAVNRLVKHVFGADTTLTHRPDGSPAIDGISKEITISHSRTHAFLATHPHRRIGIDAELPRQQLTAVSGKFLSPSELSVLTSLDELLTAWTIKEAVYKAAGIPGLFLTDIRLPEPNRMPQTATIPDGRCFRLFTAQTSTHTVTIALPTDCE